MSLEFDATFRDGATLPARPNSAASQSGDLGRDLRRLREQIVANGAPLLDEAELDQEHADRRGDRYSSKPCGE